jgi:hypothetical protein
MRLKVVLALLMLTLLLEFAGAGAYMHSTKKADPSDFCFGYAICK